MLLGLCLRTTVLFVIQVVIVTRGTAEIMLRGQVCTQNFSLGPGGGGGGILHGGYI
jgi:hypothetical protein